MPRARPPATRVDLRKQHGFGSIAALCVVVLYAPILVLVVFSFNDNRSVTLWTGFSFDWYAKAFDQRGDPGSRLQLAQDRRHRHRRRHDLRHHRGARHDAHPALARHDLRYMVINLPLMVPEIVTAIATLFFFALLPAPLGIRLWAWQPDDRAHGVLHPLRLPADPRADLRTWT